MPTTNCDLLLRDSVPQRRTEEEMWCGTRRYLITEQSRRHSCSTRNSRRRGGKHPLPDGRGDLPVPSAHPTSNKAKRCRAHGAAGARPARRGGRQLPRLSLQRLGRAGGTRDAPTPEESPHPELLPTAAGVHPDPGRLQAPAAPKPGMMPSGDSAGRGTVPTRNLSTTHSITHDSGPEIAHYQPGGGVQRRAG